MQGFRLTGDGWGIDELPRPVAGPGQALVRVLAAGLCHSDLTLRSRPAAAHPFPLPLVLGHEFAGEVVEFADGVDLPVGTSVVGYGPRGCRTCESCVAGFENYCRHRPAGALPPGLGTDGALAEYVAVDARYLLPATGLEPAQAAALTDAGLTAYSALQRAVSARRPGSVRSVVVIGCGGLGHLAVQFAAQAGVRHIVVVDVTEDKLALAARLGATDVIATGSGVVDDVRAIIGGGADAVLDFVASDRTLATAAGMVGPDGVLSIVGVGSGRLSVGMHAVPLGVRIDFPFWGGRTELAEVLQLARDGHIGVEVEEIAFVDVAQGYDRLQRGQVLGRLVARP